MEMENRELEVLDEGMEETGQVNACCSASVTTVR